MKKYLSCWFLCLVLLCMSLSPVHSFENHVWYVAPNGSDTADGTEEAPFRTLKKAVSMMQYGDTLYLREGRYEEILKPVSNTVICAFPGETPVVTACEELTG